jgi:enoyl-CoA hydratase
MGFIDYRRDAGVAVITLDRPEARNAQSPGFLKELDGAWTRAAEEKEARVIVLQANGPDFSAGHDLKRTPEERPQFDHGIYEVYEWEREVYLGYTSRWREVPKPSIAAVQGACVAAGLMLAWPCDLIMASADARFGDTVALMGVGSGVEYHGHTWEFGPRKAKELLFTAGFIGAAEAKGLGMVNHVVEPDQLRDETMRLAHKIARMDPFALAQAKRAVNTTMDVIGHHAAIEACFDQHWVGHAHVYALAGEAGKRIVELDDLARANREQIESEES